MILTDTMVNTILRYSGKGLPLVPNPNQFYREKMPAKPRRTCLMPVVVRL